MTVCSIWATKLLSLVSNAQSFLPSVTNVALDEIKGSTAMTTPSLKASYL